MPLIRHLLFSAVRRVASDPELRQRATEKAQAAGAVLRHDIDKAMDEAPETATRAEIAGRVTRRLLDRARGED